MKDYTISFLFILLILINSCGAVQEGFSNQKKNNTDEFLVEKKAPLVMPPNYNELPSPKIGNLSNQENDNTVKELISVSKEEKEINTNNNSEGLIEKSILEKIKK
tara:strand:+ start:1772 stop:2086 length:315 start_codon:yes stop_codon:yes gene_type:complete